MIDNDLREAIKRAAGMSYEQIANDFLEGAQYSGGVAYPEDAVEPTVWNMNDDHYVDPRVKVIAESYDHPDRKEFLDIVTAEVKRYF